MRRRCLVLKWRIVRLNRERSSTPIRARDQQFLVVFNFRYGVLRLFGKLEIAHFNQYNNKTNKTEKIVTSIHIDTGNNTRLEYQTPVNRSYLCTDLGDWNLLASLHYSSDDKPLGTKLPNASISTRDVQFDAFRSVQTTPLKFQVSVKKKTVAICLKIIIGRPFIMLERMGLRSHGLGSHRHGHPAVPHCGYHHPHLHQGPIQVEKNQRLRPSVDQFSNNFFS